MSIERIKVIDEKINSLNLQNKKLDEICQNYFGLIFVEENSEETDFGTHAEISKGGTYRTSELTNCDLGVPLHNLTSIFPGGGYRIDKIKYFRGKVLSRYIANRGDLLILNSNSRLINNSIGFPGVIPKCFNISGIYGLSVNKLSVKESSYLNIQFFYYLLMTQKLRHQIILETKGVGFYHVFLEDFQTLKFNLPSREKIEEFTAFVDVCWKKKEVNYFLLMIFFKWKEKLKGVNSKYYQ